MENIIEPNEHFDFSKLSLAHPVGIQGGAYFTKIECNKKPLYVQTSKSLTRQGFVKTGKKYYCDLMFDKNSESIIHWFENLEEKCKSLIYEKKDAWFQGNLEENDIENAFNPLIRVYKSGKYYLLRTNIKNTKDDVPAVKIYNEREISMNMTEVNAETELISILEIQGIKFTSRNFQVEIELKQVMVLDNEPLFDNCLIKTNKKPESSLTDNLGNIATQSMITPNLENKIDLLSENLEVSTLDSDKLCELENFSSLEENTEPNTVVSSTDIDNPNIENTTKMDESLVDIEFEDLNTDIEEKSGELKEMSNSDLNLDANEDSITLKKPNQVYFELYKEARNKAKLAKKNAILAYLEAKNIKKTYLIETINDSDSEFDAEIEDVSESELEGL